MVNDWERERVECVFGLRGGELHRKDDRFPDEWDGVFSHWYEGVPEYATEYAGDLGSEYRTAILCEVYGRARTPEGWERVASFVSSGESECIWQGAEDLPGNDEVCPLCDTSIETDESGARCHPLKGHVYIGDGYAEVVYKRTKAVALPDVGDVSEELETIARAIDPHDRYVGPTLDVRLQVLETGDWRVHVGVACYDTDHRGYWGSAEISHPSWYVESIGIAADRVARALLEQVTESARQDGLQVEESEE